MAFQVDKQTLDELNVLGKFRPGTVYHLFNRVKTRGGEQLLDAMFRKPLCGAQQINNRAAAFQYFQDKAIVFPFDVEQVAGMREYLDTSSSGGRLMTMAAVYYKKLLSGVTRDERHRKTVQGLQASIVVLNQCAALLEELEVGASTALDEQIQAIKHILGKSRVKQLLETDIYKALPLNLLANFEYFLKGSLYEDMELVLDFIHALDVFIAVSGVAGEKGFSYGVARAAKENTLQVENLRHPCLHGAVGNDLHLGEGSNLLFLTGANMAGKSTWMKSLGIGMYLAHMGFPLAADRFEFSIRDGLYSSINVADNISLGYSHFYAEVMRVKQAAQAAASGQRLMLMFDELFKGTNVKDAYDGTLAVTEGFAEYGDCLFVVSTHIIEVGEALRRFPNIQFRYMPTVMEGSVPQYTYRMKEGITEDRQGMMIIRNEGILDLLA